VARVAQLNGGISQKKRTAKWAKSYHWNQQHALDTHCYLRLDGCNGVGIVKQ